MCLLLVHGQCLVPLFSEGLKLLNTFRGMKKMDRGEQHGKRRESWVSTCVACYNDKVTVGRRKA